MAQDDDDPASNSPPIDDTALARWIAAWCDRYPNRESEDERLAVYRGKADLDRGSVEDLIDWKFSPNRRRREMVLLQRESDERIAQATRRAHDSDDELEALRTLDELSGVGPALASVILMAQAPSRYTVFDRYALASLRSLRLLPAGPPQATVAGWLPYLDACREVSRVVHRTLRDVDRALWKANGRADLPT